MLLKEMTKEQLKAFKEKCEREYSALKSKGLKLDMSRGKPSAEQLDLCMDMLSVFKNPADTLSEDGFDCRNYGLLTGITEAKRLFAELLNVEADELIIGGNSSLNLMYDSVSRAMTHGVYGSEKPWGKYERIKFLCPSPGYDRHFSICEHFNIEMLAVPVKPDGPDMDIIERLVSEDDTVKGVWCVPLYSNPDGIVYSDEVVRRFAKLSPKAKDFRIFWDNAYFVHHLAEPVAILNILEECKKAGNPDMALEFASTSKISFAGAGLSALAASKNNINQIAELLAMQSICYDKLNQLRHAKYFRSAEGVYEHMKKHKEILAPKLKLVLDMLDTELSEYGILEWNKPKGGYFISVNTDKGCAKRVIELCKDAGVVMTPAGATFPYGKDPEDRNIRIAPTFPPLDELKAAMELFCLCVKIAAAERLM